MRFISDYNDRFHACGCARVCTKHSTGLTKNKNGAGWGGRGDNLHTPILQMEEERLGEIQGHSLELGEPGCEPRQSNS